MARPTLQITTLHNYKINDLIELKNTTTCKYTRLALTIVTMKYQGYSTFQIMEATGLSKSTVLLHIRKWNKVGMASTVEHRGGKKPSKLEPEMIDELIHVVIYKSPRDFEFVAHTWTCELLSLYVYQTFGVKVSSVTIWSILKKNNLSYKRARPMPTQSDKAEQEAFKKNRTPSRYFRVF